MIKIGDIVSYKINDTFVRQARVSKIHNSSTVDLQVFVHPDDYPEFSRAECDAGHAHRASIVLGTGPGTWSVPAAAAKATTGAAGG